MRYLTLFISLYLFVACISAQNLLDVETAFELQSKYRNTAKIASSTNKNATYSFEEKYNLYCDTAIVYLETKDSVTNISRFPRPLLCDKLYSIPDSTFLMYYPFNASKIEVYALDTAVIINPGDIFDYESKWHIPANQMSRADIGAFACNFYNYSVELNDNIYSLPYSEIVKKGSPPTFSYAPNDMSELLRINTSTYDYPDIILHFHFKDEVKYLALFFDKKERIRISTTLANNDDTFFGAVGCLTLNSRLRSFFRDRYDIEIHEYTRKSDINIDIFPPLELRHVPTQKLFEDVPNDECSSK